MTEGSGAFCFQVFCKIEAKEFRTLKGIWDPFHRGNAQICKACRSSNLTSEQTSNANPAPLTEGSADV